MNITNPNEKPHLAVGDIAYPYAKPQCAGVVTIVDVPAPIKVQGQSAGPDDYWQPMAIYTIQTSNGKLYHTKIPRSLQSLIDEHKRKAESFEAKLVKLEGLKASLGL